MTVEKVRNVPRRWFAIECASQEENDSPSRTCWITSLANEPEPESGLSPASQPAQRIAATFCFGQPRPAERLLNFKLMFPQLVEAGLT